MRILNFLVTPLNKKGSECSCMLQFHFQQTWNTNKIPKTFGEIKIHIVTPTFQSSPTRMNAFKGVPYWMWMIYVFHGRDILA